MKRLVARFLNVPEKGSEVVKTMMLPLCMT